MIGILMGILGTASGMAVDCMISPRQVPLPLRVIGHGFLTVPGYKLSTTGREVFDMSPYREMDQASRSMTGAYQRLVEE